MARRLRSNILESRTQRLKLEPRAKPYWFTVASGIALGYRAGPGSWSVRCADGSGGSWIKSFAIADDHEDGDGTNVLNFWQAIDKAKALARGSDADAGRPTTVSEALTDYAADLKIRGGGAGNATHPRHHLTPALLAKPVSLLNVKELRRWRNELTAAMKASTINRICRALKAALNLAASHDDRIANRAAWTTGLATLPEADVTFSNLVLTDEQRRAVIASAHAIGAEFGLYVEVHTTGARSGQIALLNVGDLQLGAKPLLIMPSSLKGRNRRTRTRKPMPISCGLALRLQQLTAGRAANQPLLTRPNGQRWNAVAHRHLFLAAAKAAGLPEGASIYCLRHTAITRALLMGIPVRLVASSYDTSVAMIEKTYSKNITDHGDEQLRRAVFDTEVPDDDNVVPIVRR